MSATLTIAPIQDGDVPAVIALWEACGLTRPWNDPRADIALARRGPSSIVLVGRYAKPSWQPRWSATMGTAAGSVAVDPARQNSGLGARMMTAGEDWLKLHGVPKAQLMVRAENTKVVEFYEHIG